MLPDVPLEFALFRVAHAAVLAEEGARVRVLVLRHVLLRRARERALVARPRASVIVGHAQVAREEADVFRAPLTRRTLVVLLRRRVPARQLVRLDDGVLVAGGSLLESGAPCGLLVRRCCWVVILFRFASVRQRLVFILASNTVILPIVR